jgi:hypothetical protein
MPHFVGFLLEKIIRHLKKMVGLLMLLITSIGQLLPE